MMNRPRLGQLLIDQKLVSQEVIDQALHIQARGERRLGHILVQMKVITSDQLAETLAKQLNLAICNINQKLSSEVQDILPCYLCNRYSVLPLSLKENNVLEVAMSDPADEVAISIIEHFTGKAVEPVLARESDIKKAIPKPRFFTKGRFSPQQKAIFTRSAVACCFVLIVVIFATIRNYIHDTTYGTIESVSGSTIYKNHDLALLFTEKDGAIKLVGRGAFAKGNYSISFADRTVLQSFIEGKKSELSEKQQDWLKLITTEKLPQSQHHTLAAK